jgi:hypothetical protein
LPLLAHPLAVNNGAGNQAPANVVEKSKLIIEYQLNAIERFRRP